MAVNRGELIREMCKAIWEHNAAVFGGAGLSRASGYVDWIELLRPLANDIGLDVDKEHDLLEVAQFYKNQKGSNGSINQKIMDAFNKDAYSSTNVRILGLSFLSVLAFTIMGVYYLSLERILPFLEEEHF